MFATASAGYFMTCGAATAAAAGGGGCYVNLMTYSAKWATHMDGHPQSSLGSNVRTNEGNFCRGLLRAAIWYSDDVQIRFVCVAV